MSRARRVALVCGSVAVLVLLGVVAGTLYETMARRRDARAFAPPGRFVDVGGRRLHVVCLGAGQPLVLFEASGFSNALGSSRARTELARRTTVCSYDRAGVGWSDAAPGTATIGMLADDLRRLADGARFATPFVVVTASVGGLVTEMFARQHPGLVAGLVFLDAATSDAIPLFERSYDAGSVGAACTAIRAAGSIGLVRLLDPFNFRSAETEDAKRAAAVMYGAQPWNALCSLVRSVERTKQEFASAPPLPPDVRLTVLSAESTDGVAPPGLARWAPSLPAGRIEAHQQLARRSSRGTWRIVPGSAHLIASSQPGAVVDAVLEMIGR